MCGCVPRSQCALAENAAKLYAPGSSFRKRERDPHQYRMLQLILLDVRSLRIYTEVICQSNKSKEIFLNIYILLGKKMGETNRQFFLLTCSLRKILVRSLPEQARKNSFSRRDCGRVSVCVCRFLCAKVMSI